MRSVGASLALGLTLVLAAPESGWGAPWVTLRPAAGPAGSPALVSGSGFPPSSRIGLTAAGTRTQVVQASGRGAFVARLTVTGRGWVRVMSRRGRDRVVNRFHVTAYSVPGGVVEAASSRGPRVRFSPSTVVAGGVLRVHGVGYGRGARLRVSGLGRAVGFAADRRGRFAVGIPIPATVRPGVLRLVLAGGGRRVRVRLAVAGRKPVPPVPAPVPAPPPPVPKPVPPGVPSLPPPPTNASAPAITGTPWSGQVLEADNGAWQADGSIGYAYAWQRCDAAGAGCAAIHGATAPGYTAADADIGHSLRIAVTASNAGGSATATSLPTDVVTAAPGVAQAPSVPLTAQAGQTIRVTPATLTGPPSPTVTFRWQRCADTCTDVRTGQTYTPATADVGLRLQVVETAAWPAKTLVISSNKTDPVEPAVVPSGTVALWHMDDLAPTMIDSAGGHDGTLHAVATGLPGFAGTAFGFNGVNSYGAVPFAADLSPVDNDVTLTIRMKTTALPPPTVQDWDLVRSAGGYYDGDEYKMEYAPNGTAHCAFKGNGVTVYKEVESVGVPPLDDGAWHTIQCVKTATQVKTIVDGVVTAKFAQIGTIAITTGMIVGAHPNAAGGGASEFYDGALDEASLRFG